MRILHLGFEDPRQPNAGGGSWRIRQINRRLAARHEITVLTHQFPTGKPERYDGVEYRPVGWGTGRVAAVTYWGAVVPVARSGHWDLVVEEFGPPIAAGLAPLFSRAPVIGSVQWLFGDAMARKYHLPFGIMQRWALHPYRHLITMTHDTAEIIAHDYPRVRCWPVPNGLSDDDFVARQPDSGNIVFVGRLDIAQKGLDLALDVVGEIQGPDGRFLLAGDGPDRDRLERSIRDRGLQDRVHLLGYVQGESKRHLLASARALLLPSRHETFGIAALEAFAAGCPVIGFDIPSLREVAQAPAAWLVPAFDTGALRDAVATWWNNGSAAIAAGAHGPDIARRYHWDHIACQQERIYEMVASGRDTGK